MTAMASRATHAAFEELSPEVLRDIAAREMAFAEPVADLDVEVLLRQTRAELDSMIEGRIRTLVARYDARIAAYAQKLQEGDAVLAQLKAETEAQQKALHQLEGRVRAFQDWAKGFEGL